MNWNKLQQELQEKLHNEIPPTKTLLFTVETLNEKHLSLQAPLDHNINDKLTAFGGSIASLCTITGWSLCWVIAQINALNADIVIYKSQMKYARPIKKDFTATVAFPPKERLQDLIEKLATKKRASLTLDVSIKEDNKVCVQYSGEYVLLID